MAVATEALFQTARRQFHAGLKERVLRFDGGVLSNADKHNPVSKSIALGIGQKIGITEEGKKLTGQEAGNQFEVAVARFLRETFTQLDHLRPGGWHIEKIGEKSISPIKPLTKETTAKELAKPTSIARFEQYRHLVAIAQAAKQNLDLAALLGNDYIIKPDVVIFRDLVEDHEINMKSKLVDGSVALKSSLRKSNGGSPILHASISCKLTIRSDRSQNSRSEALNLIRNRRGNLPYIVVVTGEPLPSRLSSIALGGGDIDCVYHYALPELVNTVKDLGLADSEEALNIMIAGRRLKDISDLPLDLAV